MQSCELERDPHLGCDHASTHREVLRVDLEDVEDDGVVAAHA